VFNVAFDSDSVGFNTFVVTCAVAYCGWVYFEWWDIGIIVILIMVLSHGKFMCLHFFDSHFDFFVFVEECLFQVGLVQYLMVDVEHVSNCHMDVIPRESASR